MQRSSRRGVGILAGIVMLAVVTPAYAETHGMERRGDRRNDRAGGRSAKQACKAGDEKSRAECRQVKRTTKHGGGQHGQPGTRAEPGAMTARAGATSDRHVAPLASRQALAPGLSASARGGAARGAGRLVGGRRPPVRQ